MKGVKHTKGEITNIEMRDNANKGEITQIKTKKRE